MLGTRDPECYVMENGTDYRGYKSVAVDGYTCLNWTITTSYRYEYNPMDYPDAGLGDHNYCRNPNGSNVYDFDGNNTVAWCYIDDVGTPDICDIGIPNLECTPSML